MNKILQILIQHSIRDLFRYKSFFFLIFVLILADRGIKKIVPVDRGELVLPSFNQWSTETAHYVFEELPALLIQLLTDYRTFLVMVALFLFKQLISLWPSSDMRRMHRKERGTFGLIASLLSIGWRQVVWDGIAVGSICLLSAIWIALWYALAMMFWVVEPLVLWLFGLGTMVALIFPIIMAGFSYSSKLAVIAQGSFAEKLALFFQLFLNLRVLGHSWLFFSFRLAVEGVFVVIIPALVLLTVDIFWVRIMVATFLATPVYSYLKMASFKFFLHVYRHYKLVYAEYGDYYRKLGMGRF
jgi:hypothetical protein